MSNRSYYANHSDYSQNPYEKHLKVIGQALHDFMRDTGCRAAQLATLIGISRTTINNIIANAQDEGCYSYYGRPQVASLDALRLIPLGPTAMTMLDDLSAWERHVLKQKM